MCTKSLIPHFHVMSSAQYDLNGVRGKITKYRYNGRARDQTRDNSEADVAGMATRFRVTRRSANKWAPDCAMPPPSHRPHSSTTASASVPEPEEIERQPRAACPEKVRNDRGRVFKVESKC